MVKRSYSLDYDQHDQKVFRESLGTFGTTTVPGGNQLTELQTKIRQGVKHVELHLNSRAKGEFNKFDTPDKYGFEQRRTIMQLAKLNEQTLSVHSSLSVTSFSGFDNRGFSEAVRWESIKEIDESIKFGAETAKGGAVVVHMQGDQMSGSRTEINLTSGYLKWLEKNKPDEYKRLQNTYFNKNPLHRTFQDNPEKIFELKQEYDKLDSFTKKNFESKYEYELKEKKISPHDLYYIKNQEQKIKLQPDYNPLVVIGDHLDKVERGQDFVDINLLKQENNFNEKEKKLLQEIGINFGKKMGLEDVQKAMSTFVSKEGRDFQDYKTYNDLKKKLLITYESVFEKNNYLQGQADSEFFKKSIDVNVNILDMQKDDLQNKYEIYKDVVERIKTLENENKGLLEKRKTISGDDEQSRVNKDILKQEIAMKTENILRIIQTEIGQQEYHDLKNFNETLAKINKQKKDLEEKASNAKSFADVSFDKNVSAMGYLGIKALKYQLDLMSNAEKAQKDLPEKQKKLIELEKKYEKESDFSKQEEISSQISKLRSEVKNLVGLKDYIDKDDGIDIINKPLYVSPENMLPGMGSMTSIEDFKAMIRMAQEDFKEKIMSESDDTFKQVREQYEKRTGQKVDEKVAKELAQRHLAGTFDTAHAGTWLKHFKRETDSKTGKLESEENKIERFNKWLNNELKGLIEEKLVKHIHFNDTIGKDDDHALLGQGVLDMHELRKTLRKAGIKEALMVEYGGRAGHLNNAFDMFNPTLSSKQAAVSNVSSGVSDWINVSRNYSKRIEYSNYGMNYSTFRHQPPAQGKEKGDWSGTGFF